MHSMRKKRRRAATRTKQEYDKHINETARFLAHLAAIDKDLPADVLKTNAQLWESLGKAFMALRRERIEKYGHEETEDGGNDTTTA